MKTINKVYFLDKEGFIPDDICLGEECAGLKVSVDIHVLESKRDPDVIVIEKLYTSYDPRKISLYRLESGSLAWVFDAKVIMKEQP